MNTESILIFLVISLIGMAIFWLMFRNANNTNAQAQKYLLTALQDTSISQDQRKLHENQLSNLLKKDKANGSFRMTAILTPLLVITSFILYYYYGTPNAVNLLELANNQQSSKPQTSQTSQAPQLSMNDAIAQLEQRLSENPDDVDGQMLYARSQISLNNYEKAVIAYRKSNSLVPNEPVILTELAEAIALANNNRSFLGEPEQLLDKAVKLDPNNQKALWLLGMTYYERKDYAKTNEIWTNLYEMINDEGAKGQLQEQLTDIRAKLGIKELATSNNQSNPPNTDTKTNSSNNTPINTGDIHIQIQLADNLKNNLKGKRALLYIYTKETSGMPMPIAVVRKPLEQIIKGFPIEVSMNDGNSLQPTRKLSDFEQIVLGARISFTGNAMPQAGDLQSAEIRVDLPNNGKIELLIDTVR
jgi:cytochrome c-type biogenesis protein CcmH